MWSCRRRPSDLLGLLGRTGVFTSARLSSSYDTQRPRRANFLSCRQLPAEPTLMLGRCRHQQCAGSCDAQLPWLHMSVFPVDLQGARMTGQGALPISLCCALNQKISSAGADNSHGQRYHNAAGKQQGRHVHALGAEAGMHIEWSTPNGAPNMTLFALQRNPGLLLVQSKGPPKLHQI